MPYHSLWDPSVEWAFSAYFDDSYNFLENPQVSTLIPLNLKHIAEIARFQGINVYEPVWNFFRAAEMDLLGADPRSLRTVTLSLHSLNAFLLFTLLRALIGSSWLRQGICAAVALIWWLHPLHVEVVGWLSAQGYALALAQTLVSSLCLETALLLRHRTKFANAFFVASLFLYVTASLTKAPAVMLAPVLVLRSFFLFSGAGLTEEATCKSRAGGVAWYQVSCFTAAAVLLHAIAHNNAHNSSSFKGPSSFPELALGALRGSLTVATALRRVGWPLDLRPHYRVPNYFFSETSYEPRPAPSEVLARQPEVALSLVFLLTVSWAVLQPMAFPNPSPSPSSSPSEARSQHLKGARAFGWVAFLLFWLPCCGLVPHGWEALGGDRYSYIPDAFLSVAVAAFLVDALEDSSERRRCWWQSALLLLPLLLAFVLLCSTFYSLSDESLRTWQTDGHFLRRCVDRDPLDSDCHQHLAEWSGEHEKDDEKGTIHRELAMATLKARDLKDYFLKARTRLLMTPADSRPGCDVVKEAALFAAAHDLWEGLPRSDGAGAGAAGAAAGAAPGAAAGSSKRAGRPAKVPLAHLGMLLANACVCDAAEGRETASLPVRTRSTDQAQDHDQAQGQVQGQGQEESKEVLLSAVLARLRDEDSPPGLVDTLLLHRDRQNLLQRGKKTDLGPLEAAFFW